jgi:hypothetical protein
LAQPKDPAVGPELPASVEYEPGTPIPAGYALGSRAAPGPFVAGAVMFAAGYGVSIVTATGGALVDDDAGRGLLPMFVPLVGPFISVTTADPGGATALWLTLDGLVQIAGVSLMVGSLVVREERLEFRDPARYYAAQRSAAWALRPRELRYDEDRGPVPGYHVEERRHRGLLIAGALIFGISYGVSALVGATGLAEGEDGFPVAPLLIPLAGPVVTIGTAAEEAEQGYALGGLAVVQAAGAALFAAGLAANRRVLVRDAPSADTGWDRPRFGLRPGGAQLTWQLE